jgi:hypothetical protein
MKKLYGVLIAVVVMFLSGCATPIRMSPTKETQALETTKSSVLLMSLTMKNDFHPSYQPSPIVVNVERGDANQRADRLNFLFDQDGTEESKTENHYLVRMSLPPGKYVVRGITAQSGIFPFHGMCYTPLNYDIEVKPNSIVYLGHVDAAVVERKDGELRAGPVIPLIDQAATGFSGGTWTVDVADRFDQDMGDFRKVFPVLEKADVQDEVLPAWDKKKATDWWQAH